MLGYMAKGHQGCRWIKVGFNQETLLDYLDGPSVITKALRRGREEQELEVRVMQCENNSVHIAGIEDGEGGHKPRNADTLQTLEKARKQILPQSLQEGVQPRQRLLQRDHGRLMISRTIDKESALLKAMESVVMSLALFLILVICVLLLFLVSLTGDLLIL